MTQLSDLGGLGLAVMGANLARNAVRIPVIVIGHSGRR